MKKTLLIDGGFGRILTAIPALEIYVTKYPDTIILVSNWGSLIWGNKILTNNIFDAHGKGILDLIKNTKIIKPEPYYNSDYICGKINLINAWHQEINETNTNILSIPKIYLSQEELNSMSFIRNNHYTKIIAFQPFGSTAVIHNNDITDASLRSINFKTTKYLIKVLRDQGYGIWLMTDKIIPWLDQKDFIGVGSNKIRETAALLYYCDYFLGIDSGGQHMARSLNIPGSVIMGATNTKNSTYPEHFNIINDCIDKYYMPYRIAEFDHYLATLANADIMNFSDKDLYLMSKNILKHIEKSTKHSRQTPSCLS